MKRYDEKILHALLDKYENSLLYTGENKRKQTISFVIRKRTLPEYFDESSQDYAAVHAQLAWWEERGLIRLVWKNGKSGHILERCVLVPDRAQEIYSHLHRRPRKDKEEAVVDVCDRFLGEHQVLDRFLLFVRERIRKGEGIGQYVNIDRPEELSEKCRLVLHILGNREERFLREFSIAYLNDSKAAEKEIAGAAAIIARFSGDGAMSELSAEQILEEYNIYRNPSWVMVKGAGRLRLGEGGDAVGLRCLRDGLGLSSRDIEAVCWDTASKPERIVTIENLTSFHRFEERGTLAVYLGGYHNRIKREFLRRLHDSYLEADYGHFGDMDCGGFLIWKDLCLKTGIPFRVRYMDTETYLAYQSYGRELTEHDRKELKRMSEDPFFEGQRELFGLMLETGKKVEQECVRVQNQRQRQHSQ